MVVLLRFRFVWSVRLQQRRQYSQLKNSMEKAVVYYNGGECVRLTYSFISRCYWNYRSHKSKIRRDLGNVLTFYCDVSPLSFSVKTF